MKINPETDALLVIDVQPTFMPGGGLSVFEGDKIVPIVENIFRFFPRTRRFATKDRHPRGHISLASSYSTFSPMVALTPQMIRNWSEQNHGLAPHAKFTLSELNDYLSVVGAQMLWSEHALEGTAEAELHPALVESDFAHVLIKGMDPKCDSYSGFFDNLGRPTGLSDILREAGVRRCFFVGLAFDYCVGWSAEGAVKEGFEVIVIEDATRPVGYPPGRVTAMRASLERLGAKLIQSSELFIG